MSELGDRQRISVVVCTLNEEKHLARMLDSVDWADEVLVVDCGSTDSTRDVALAGGARWEEEPWRGFSAQKNLGAARASHKWVLSLDADEIVTPRLRDSIMDVLASDPDPHAMYFCDRQGDFLGEVLPSSYRRARRMVRLYHKSVASWDETMMVHERVSGGAREVALEGSLLHFNDLSMDEYFALFNRYASKEAEQLAAGSHHATVLDIAGRPLARFVWHYVVLGEWRLGRRGLIHSGVKAVSDFMRYSKLYEIDLKDAGHGLAQSLSETFRAEARGVGQDGLGGKLGKGSQSGLDGVGRGGLDEHP